MTIRDMSQGERRIQSFVFNRSLYCKGFEQVISVFIEITRMFIVHSALNLFISVIST